MSDATNKAVKSERMQLRNIHILQLAQYRLPLAALVSILHRASGVLMFLLLPLILFVLDKSLASENTFDYFHSVASHWLVKLIILALSWAYFHHFCAGLRHLFMDCHIGIEKDSSKKSAAAVLAVSLLLTLLVAMKLFGVM